MKYLTTGVIALFLMSPAMFILYSTIIHQDNTYDTYLIAIVVGLFLMGASLPIIDTGK